MDATAVAPLLPVSRFLRPSARRSLAAAALLLACGAPARAETAAPPVLRVDGPRLAAAVVRGRDQSPTFRAILERLSGSDLIVYVRRGQLSGTTAAATQLQTSTGDYRYVRVTLELDPETDAGLALLGHELWHALELAEAPWVTDDAGVHSLYQKIGFRTCEGSLRCYDTEAAVATGRQVLRELRGGGGVEPLYPLGLPVALREEPRADTGQGEEGKAHGDERAGRTEPCAVREQPRQRDLEHPEHHEVDPGGRARVAGAVERLGEHHAVAGECEAERDDPQATNAVARHLGIARKDRDQPGSKDQKY
jgi:hypothetical protein